MLLCSWNEQFVRDCLFRNFHRALALQQIYRCQNSTTNSSLALRAHWLNKLLTLNRRLASIREIFRSKNSLKVTARGRGVKELFSIQACIIFYIWTVGSSRYNLPAKPPWNDSFSLVAHSKPKPPTRTHSWLECNGTFYGNYVVQRCTSHVICGLALRVSMTKCGFIMLY